MNEDRTKASLMLFKMLRSGSGGTSENMNVDGTTPVNFDYTCSAGIRAIVSRINLTLVDGAMQYGKFGGLTALTVGIKVKVYDTDGSVLVDFLDGETIKTNEDWALLTGTDSIIEPAAGDDSIAIRWTIKNTGKSLHLQPGQYLRFTIADNLSALSTFKGMVHGYYEDY